MTAASRPDLVVVGAGIVGLAHAVVALERGLSVEVIDRDARAVGASVRNFGHACVTAQDGDLHDLALAARTRWLRLARDAGFWARESGGLALARTEAERAVLEELSTARGREEVRMLDRAGAIDLLGAPGDPAILGGAALSDDLRVDPREAVGAIAEWVAAQPGARIRWRTSYLGFDGEAVLTSRGPIATDRVVLCVGHDLDALLPDVADANEIVRCALQMALCAPPDGVRITRPVLTGTSMLRYGAFTATGASAALREELEASRPDLIDLGANVMLTHRPDGTLIVGDSHAYAPTHPPFLDEGWSTTLLDEIARVLGAGPLTVLQRWQGVYASSDRRPYVVASPSPGVTAVTVSSGVGMTIGLGLAERGMAAAFS